jgi:hypothetical protein
MLRKFLRNISNESFIIDASKKLLEKIGNDTCEKNKIQSKSLKKSVQKNDFKSTSSASKTSYKLEELIDEFKFNNQCTSKNEIHQDSKVTIFLNKISAEKIFTKNSFNEELVLSEIQSKVENELNKSFILLENQFNEKLHDDHFFTESLFGLNLSSNSSLCCSVTNVNCLVSSE